MAKLFIDPRTGRVGVDHRDAFGRRKRPTFPNTPEGKKKAQSLLTVALNLERLETDIDPDITSGDYCELWLDEIRGEVKLGNMSHYTLAGYESTMRLHVLPLVGHLPLRALTRKKVKAILRERAARPCSKGHLGNLVIAIRSMLSAAVDDEILEVNPLFRFGKRAKKGIEVAPERTRELRAMDRAQRSAFLADVQRHEPRFYPPLATLAYAGLRQGEMRGLQRHDLRDGALWITRQVYEKINEETGSMVGPPKSKAGTRRVDLADKLQKVLLPLAARPGKGPWVFFDCTGEPTEKDASRFVTNLRAAMARSLRRTSLPSHFTPHDLRHTCACAIITQAKEEGQRKPGDLLEYLRSFLGHESVGFTSKVYARHIQQSFPDVVNDAAEDERRPPPSLPRPHGVLPFARRQK